MFLHLHTVISPILKWGISAVDFTWLFGRIVATHEKIIETKSFNVFEVLGQNLADAAK